MASKELESVLQLIREFALRDLKSVEEMRQQFEADAKMFKLAEDIRCEPVRANRLQGEWIVPPEAVDDRVVVYLHGGGYVTGSINTHREMVSRISRASAARGLLVKYRLAPEHPYPAALEDAGASYEWLLAEGWEPGRIVIAGDSAGGGLTVALQVSLRERGYPLPAASVCISPWVDLEGTAASMITKADVDPIVQREDVLFLARMYLGKRDRRTPLAAPLYADLTGLPPMLIQVGTSETLLDDATRLAARAEEAGVKVVLEAWEDMFHVWHWFASMLPEGRDAIAHIGGFVQQHTE